ncbi:MAG: hypothetical protein AAGG55_08300 [Pseudomonadota bacterium]
MSAAAELRRLQYLQAMGVTPLVSRRALPGAAASQRLYLKNAPKNIGQGSEIAPADQSRETNRTASESAQAMRASLRSDARRSAEVPVQKTQGITEHLETAPEAVQPQVSERFSLIAVRCASRLWVEDLGGEALAQDQLQLIAAMGRALQHSDGERVVVTHTQFDWPLHGNMQLDLGNEEAAATLEGFLQRQLDEHGCVELVCLGEAAAERVNGLRLPVAARQIHSSRELLSNATLKKAAWDRLRN